jgi:hypothetical protein
MYFVLTVNKNGKVSEVNLNSYLDIDMKHKIIQSIKLPPLDESFVLRTFKVNYLLDFI